MLGLCARCCARTCFQVRRSAAKPRYIASKTHCTIVSSVSILHQIVGWGKDETIESAFMSYHMGALGPFETWIARNRVHCVYTGVRM